MKISGLAVGLAALLLAGSAQAAVIFDNITGVTMGGTTNLRLGNNGTPFGDSFSVAGPALITSISLVLADSTNTDGGFISVYLVSDASGIPSSTGRVLNGKTPLGVITDSSLPTAVVVSGGVVTPGAIQTLTTNLSVAAGRYWIELVNSGDTDNGSNGSVSNAVWSGVNNGAGVGTTGEFYSFTNNTNVTITSASDTTGPFQMIVTATLPEPASMAILGAGLAGLSLVRRRQRGKTSL